MASSEKIPLVIIYLATKNGSQKWKNLSQRVARYFEEKTEGNVVFGEIEASTKIGKVRKESWSFR